MTQCGTENAMSMLASCIGYETGLCDLAAFADDIAHIRIAMSEDYSDMQGQIVAFLDEVNAALTKFPRCNYAVQVSRQGKAMA